jgi:hypothetical protein
LVFPPPPPKKRNKNVPAGAVTRYEELFAHVLLDAQTGRGRARPAKNEMMMDFLLLSKPLKLSRLGHPAGPLLAPSYMMEAI